MVSGVSRGLVLESAASGLVLPAELWLKATRFQPVTQAQTLDAIETAVMLGMREYQAHGGKRPTVVVDLDDTAFRSNQSRSWRIMQAWMAERPDLHWNIRRTLSTLKPESLAYDLRDTFAKAGGLDMNRPEVAAALKDLQAYWLPRFFSNEWVLVDPLQHGVLAFAKRLHDLGANLAYVTGRDEPRMGKGTRTAIAKSGLPWNSDRVKLILKPSKDVDDAAFKQSVCGKLAAWGNVVATFDNAPANCVVLAKAFPDAMNVFVDTVYSPAPVEVWDGLYRILDFDRRR